MYDIIPVSGFRYGATIYPTEAEATKAALNDLASRIIKQHSSNPVQGFTDNAADLIRLLALHLDHTAPTAEAEVTSESQGEPKE